jgi:Domain of unknown function (DUF4388)
MQGNLSSTSPIELLQTLGSRNIPGLLRVRPGNDEALIYIAANSITQATYRTLNGLDALIEFATWRSDTWRFEENNFSFNRNLSMSVTDAISSLQTANVLRELRPVNDTGSMFFYSQAIDSDATLSPLETNIVSIADGATLEDLVRRTGQDAKLLVEALRNLMNLGLLSGENVPCTPEKLRAIRPRLAPPPKLAFFSRPKAVSLEPFVLKVYDQVDGGRSLWDIHLNLGCSRQAIWDAYNHLHGLKLVVPAT